MTVHPDRVWPVIASVLGGTAVVWTVLCGAVPPADAVQALLVPCLFLIGGLIGPVWAASRFTCRWLAAVGLLHLSAAAVGGAALTGASSGLHLAAQLLFTAGFAALLPLAAGYPSGPPPRWTIVSGCVACLLPVAAAFSAPTPAVLYAGSRAPLLAPIASALPPEVAAASAIVLLLPAGAVVIAVVRAVRGGRELRGRLLVPLIGLALFAGVLTTNAALPPGGRPVATTLFLVAVPLVPAGLVLGARPLTAPAAPTSNPVPAGTTALALDGLTPRQLEVLAAMADGRSNTEIASTLHMSLSAVEKHTSAIFQRLGLEPDGATHRRVAAVVAYLRASR